MAKRPFSSLCAFAVPLLSVVLSAPFASADSPTPSIGGPANASSDNGSGGASPGQIASIAAEATTDSQGDFTTHVNIEAPAYFGIEPKLALDYRSGGGNGPLGVGWTLAGLSSIRTASTHWGMPGYAPPYAGGDLYTIDGMEVYPCAQLAQGAPSPLPTPSVCSIQTRRC